ncbi:hypothetical protein E6H33_01295 [Candidatus Bathyarchaeota archaeon]|nr:MAG: hypothetical protein E6H33_01295 [Candidatus Bathyarchaeota archaeon]
MVESVEGSSTWFLAYSGTEILYRNLLNQNNQAYVSAVGIKLVRVVDRTATYYYHTDALGSTRMITYNDATYVFINNYQPFGKDNGTPKGNLASSEKDRFTGKPYSPTTGLYYNYQRWYDPAIGRFISPDANSGQLSNPQSFNLYVSVFNNPLSYVDPDGASPLDALGGLWGALGIASKVAFAFTWKIHGESFQQIQHGSVVVWDSTTYWSRGHTVFAGYDIEPVRGEGEMITKLDLPGHGVDYSHLGGGWFERNLGREHLPAPGAGEAVSSIFRYGSKISKGLVFAGLAVSALNIYNAYQADAAGGSGYTNTIRAVAIEAASWAGAYVGAEVGLIVGCMVLPGLGCVIGALVGSVVGAYSGDFLATTLTSPSGPSVYYRDIGNHRG